MAKKKEYSSMHIVQEKDDTIEIEREKCIIMKDEYNVIWIDITHSNF